MLIAFTVFLSVTDPYKAMMDSIIVGCGAIGVLLIDIMLINVIIRW